SRGSGVRQRLNTKRPYTNKIYGTIKKGHANNSKYERTGQIAARVLQLSSYEARCLPASVGKKNRNHRTTEVRHQSARDALVNQRCPQDMRAANQESSRKNQQADSEYLGDHQRTLHRSAGTDAQSVDDCENEQGEHCNLPVAGAKARQFQKISGERDCDGSHTAGLNY